MNPNITPQYWMRIAREVANASTCRVKVGCILIRRNHVIGIGYVGSISGDHHCTDVGCVFVSAPHQGSSDSGESCIRTIHAEMNAVLKCVVRGNANDGWISCYCTHQPCLNCTKALLQIGVREIWYERPYKDEWRDLFLKKLNQQAFFNLSFGNLTINQVSYE